jgi:hypothetical protein
VPVHTHEDGESRQLFEQSQQQDRQAAEQIVQLLGSKLTSR